MGRESLFVRRKRGHSKFPVAAGGEAGSRARSLASAPSRHPFHDALKRKPSEISSAAVASATTVLSPSVSSSFPPLDAGRGPVSLGEVARYHALPAVG